MTDRQLGFAFERRVDRRQFLTRTAGAGVAFSSLPALLAACGGDDDDDGGGGEAAGERARVRWISPRATLEVMDDYNLWVPIKQGYFDDLNLDVQLIAGPQDILAPTKFVAENQADMGYPSPGVLVSSIASGVPVISIWEQYPAQVFGFSLPADSDITSAEQLEGKRIAAGFPGAEVIIDPLLVEIGVDPDSVTVVDGGQQWNQIVAQGQADAGLIWEGLRAQLLGQGLELKFLLGSEFSDGPSNVYSVRKSDLENEGRRDAYTRFLQGVVMGFEFGKTNPRAAAQLTYEEFPALQETLEPQVALESMMQLASGYGATARAGQGWGYHVPEAWERYINALADLGQIEEPLDPAEVFTNDFVEPANSGADVDRARSDAEAFELSDEFADTKPPADLPL
jgi:NitT/TauT family transport system substrate-binding protein